MKKIIWMSLILLCLSALTVSAQENKSKIAISGIGGLAIPVGDFASIDPSKGNAKTGYSLGGSVEYFFKEKLSLGLNFMYNTFDDKDADTIKNRLYNYGLCGRYILNSDPELQLYLKFGLGLAKFKIERPDSTRSYDIKPAVAGGLGFSYVLNSRFSMFGEAIFNHVILKNAEYSVGGVQYPALGYNLQHFGLYTGIIFYFKTKSSPTP